MIAGNQSYIRMKVILVVSAVTAVLIFIVLLLAQTNVSPEEIRKGLTGFVVITAGVSFFWWWFNKCGWRQLPALGRLVRDWPDLNGRWVGTIDRDGPDPSHEFVLEIYQTLTLLRCDTYSRNGESHSVIADISTSQDGNQFYLAYVWSGGTTGAVRRRKSGEFFGTTLLRYSALPGDRLLEGNYWSDRTPHQTKGRLQLKFESRNLLQRFS